MKYDIILLSPPYKNLYDKLDIEKIGYCDPPMGLAYLSSYLKKYSYKVKLIDLQFSKDFKKAIALFNFIK